MIATATYCPECGSKNVEVDERSEVLGGDCFHCRQCDHAWTMTEADYERRYEAGLLRAMVPTRLMSIAAGGGPRSNADYDAVYCPRCNCNRSGCPDTPNAETDACQDSACLCHRDLP